MSALEPLEVERRCLLFLSSVFAVVGFSVGLNALVKANQARSYINLLVVPHGIIDIGIHDVFATGAVITAICALLAILSGVFCALTWHPIKHKAYSFRIHSWVLFLCATWLFATLVTYDYFFVNRSAQITINLHGQPIPEPIVQHLANILDFPYAYRDVYCLRLLAVLPWFAFILAMIAGVVLHLAACRADASVPNAEQNEKCDPVGP
ncbi:hypothetical protein J3R82DRAFT_2938 [Butyriboletus roseoflavus]|nr:hypothetical protein J3R82DRAFT_2938 [Butyriboletus roseoflavus]